MIGRFYLTACALLTPLVPTASHAAVEGACTDLASKIESKIGAVKKSVEDHGVTLELKLPAKSGSELRVVCPAFAKSPKGYSLVATWNPGSDPTDEFVRQTAAAAATMTEEGEDKLRGAVRTCQREATQAQTSTAELEAGKAYLNCQSFARLGGATTITIYHNLAGSSGR